LAALKLPACLTEESGPSLANFSMSATSVSPSASVTPHVFAQWFDANDLLNIFPNYPREP
jgi:hypothetical protein